MIQRRLVWTLSMWLLVGCSEDGDMGPAELAPPAGDPGDGVAGPPGSEPADTPGQDTIDQGTPGEAGGAAPVVPGTDAGTTSPDAGNGGMDDVDDDEPDTTTPAGPPSESAIAPLTTARQEHAVVAAAGRIYVIGGFAPGETATMLAYDPAGDSWQPAASFPVAMHHANAAVIDDVIYVAGYLTGLTFSAQGEVYSYDPGQDQWTPRTAMPTGEARGSACVAALDGKLYVIGGSRGGAVAQASTYDPALDQWDSLPPLPSAREHCIAGAIDGVLYVASGRAGGISGFESPTYAFDPAIGTWDERTAIPTPRGGTAGAVLHGRLYVFGGEGNGADPSGVFPDIQAYDPATDQWEELDGMQVPRHGFGAATLGDTIYLPGGATVQAFGAVTDSSQFGFEAN